MTDALLLLAGSPQKIPPQVQSQLDHSASVLSSGKQNAVTPPKKKTHSVQERLNTNDKRPNVDSLSSQANLITSLFPYVRALDFNLDKGPEPVKRGKKRGSKAKNGAKQKTTTDGHSKAPLTKKGARSNRRHLEASKSPSSSSSLGAAAGYRNVQAVSPSIVATNVYSGISQPIPNCGSVFNGSTNPISSTVVPSACSNTSPYHMVNCGTLPTGLPVSTCSLAIRPSPSPGNLVTPSAAVSSTVSYVNPGSVPTSSLVTQVNSISGPVNFISAVTSHSSSPANHTNLRSSPVLVNSNNSSTYLTPSTVNFTTCGTVSSPFIPGNTGSVCTFVPVNLTTQHTTVSAPSTVSFMNSVACPTSASSVNLANMTNSHPALPTSIGLSSGSLLHQVVNTVTSSPLTELTPAVIPGHFTDSSVVTSTTNINNSLTSQEQNAGSNRSGTSGTNTDITQEAVGPFSLQASNLLQTLALQHTNTEKNDPQNIPSGPDVTQLRKESAQGLQKILARSTSELVPGHQPLKENLPSKKNVNLPQDNATISSEKYKDDTSVVCESLNPDQLQKGLRDTVTIARNLPNSLENINGSTSTLTMNQGCRELMKENSTSFLQSGTSSETEGQGSSKPGGKRRRDALQKEKVNICFPDSVTKLFYYCSNLFPSSCNI